MTVIVDFIKNNLVAISACGAFIAWVILTWRNYLDGRKLKLEITKLKRELEEKRSPISIATLNQIIELTNKKDIKGLNKLLRESLENKTDQKINLSEEEALKYSETIEIVENSFHDFGLYKYVYYEIIVLYLLLSFNHFTISWILGKSELNEYVQVILAIALIIFWAIIVNKRK